jgi:hypothetical protein
MTSDRFTLPRRTVAAAILGAVVLAGCQPAAPPPPDPVKRGEYLVLIGGCNDCHTPWGLGADGVPKPDMTKMLSGHPANAPFPNWTPADMAGHALAKAGPTFTSWAGPWGVSFTANLTPDKATGLGEWTFESFAAALRTGKHQGQPDGRQILPPMPWENYGKAEEEDLRAIWAYLQSIPAVSNQVPVPVPPSGPPPGS